MGRDRLTLVEIFHVPNKIIKLDMIINTKGKFYILTGEYDTSNRYNVNVTYDNQN